MIESICGHRESLNRPWPAANPRGPKHIRAKNRNRNVRNIFTLPLLDPRRPPGGPTVHTDGNGLQITSGSAQLFRAQIIITYTSYPDLTVHGGQLFCWQTGKMIYANRDQYHFRDLNIRTPIICIIYAYYSIIRQSENWTKLWNQSSTRIGNQDTCLAQAASRDEMKADCGRNSRF